MRDDFPTSLTSSLSSILRAGAGPVDLSCGFREDLAADRDVDGSGGRFLDGGKLPDIADDRDSVRVEWGKSEIGLLSERMLNLFLAN